MLSKSSALESECQFSAVPGRQTFECLFTNQLMSVTCSFDGGPGEPCAFPLEVGIDRFGTDNHTLVVTVVDVFGQSLSIPFRFSLTESKPSNVKKLTYLMYLNCSFSATNITSR